MHDAHERLDELLTATIDYREELAREIMSRVNLLQEQMSAMSSAASTLLGRPVEEGQAPPDREPELRAAYQQIESLDEQIGNLQKALESAPEPLSQKLAETEAEVQEARDLAGKRDRELEAALKEVTRLEQELARMNAMALANSAIGLDPGEDRLAGEVMFKDSGRRDKPYPVFAFPRANQDLYEEAAKRLRERFRVYYLEDGSVLYKPTGVRVPVAGESQATPPEERKPSEEEPPRVRVSVTEPVGLARSPKPIAEMRPGERDKEARLEELVRFLQQYDKRTFNSSDLNEDMGREDARKSATYHDLQTLEKRGVIERTGKLVYPRAIAEARRLDPSKQGGRPAVEFRLVEEYQTPPGDPQAVIRDYMIEAGEGNLVSPTQVANATEMEVGTVLEALESMVRRGMVEDKSPSQDMRLFTYAGKPTPSPAPKGNNEDKPRRPVGGSGVAGTGRGLKAPNKDVQDLINAAKRAGARVVHEASGHFAVTIPHSGKRVLIAATPSNPRTVLNDRSRLRRAGLALA